MKQRNLKGRAFTLFDVLAVICCLLLMMVIVFPAIGSARRSSGVNTSLGNLTTLGIAQAIYAADWNGRQYTMTIDDIAAYGVSPSQAADAYADEHGGCSSGSDPGCLPPLLLGWSTPGLWAYWMNFPGNLSLSVPFNFVGPSHAVRWGWYIAPNAKPLHDYVDGRFYSPAFYAPNDPVPYALVESGFDDPREFIPEFEGTQGNVYWSSYSLSPAALMSPDVLRSPADGGYQNPWELTYGWQCPGLYQARYANLKTFIIEQRWNQNPPADVCNPAFENGTYDGCEPYFFNHGLASEPATLFYDLSVRLLPNTEVLAADELLIEQTGFGLWSRDTPLGEDGYFNEYGYDLFSLSHHILTTDGILGRDTLPDVGASPRRFTKPLELRHPGSTAPRSPALGADESLYMSPGG